MKKRRIMAAGALLAVLAAGLSLGVGAGQAAWGDALAALWGEAPPQLVNIVRNVRLPRILTALTAGAILAAAGCAVQGVFRNPLASPHVLGTVNASALGAVIGLYWGHAAGVPLMVPLAIAGGVAATLLLLLPARVGNDFTGYLILAGIAVNAFASALTSGILYLADERLQGMVFWLLGGFWRADYAGLACLAGAAVPGIALMALLHREMDVLALGESAARGSGVAAARVQLAMVVAAAVMTAVCVSFCGVIGFVGLLVPHLAGMAGMVHFRDRLAASVIGGALLLLLADLLARTLAAPLEIPVGIFTSLIGAPFFMALLISRARRAG